MYLKTSKSMICNVIAQTALNQGNTSICSKVLNFSSMTLCLVYILQEINKTINNLLTYSVIALT